MAYTQIKFSSSKYSRSKLQEFFERSGVRAKRDREGDIKTVWSGGSHYFWVEDSYDIGTVRKYAQGYASGAYSLSQLPTEQGYYPEQGILIDSEGQGMSIAPDQITYYDPKASQVIIKGKGFSVASEEAAREIIRQEEQKQTIQYFFDTPTRETAPDNAASRALATLTASERQSLSTTHPWLQYAEEKASAPISQGMIRERPVEAVFTWIGQRGLEFVLPFAKGAEFLTKPAAYKYTASFLGQPYEEKHKMWEMEAENIKGYIVEHPGEFVGGLAVGTALTLGVGAAAKGIKPTMYKVTVLEGVESQQMRYLLGRGVPEGIEGGRVIKPTFTVGKMRPVEFTPAELETPHTLAYIAGKGRFNIERIVPRTFTYETPIKPEIPDIIQLKDVGKVTGGAAAAQEGQFIAFRGSREVFKPFKVERPGSIGTVFKGKPSGRSILSDLYRRKPEPSPVNIKSVEPEPLPSPARSGGQVLKAPKVRPVQVYDTIPISYDTIPATLPSSLSLAAVGLGLGSLSRQSMGLKPSSKLGSMSLLDEMSISDTIIDVDITQRQPSKSSLALMPKLDMAQGNILKTELEQTDIGISFDISIPTMPRRPGYINFDLPDIGGRSSFRMPKLPDPTRGFRYTPSLVALLGKITGKRQPKRITGFGIRPIVRR